MQLMYSVQKIPVAERSQENFLGQQSPNALAPGTNFPGKTVRPWTRGREDSLGTIQAHYIYCVLYFYYCNIRSTSGHLTLD